MIKGDDLTYKETLTNIKRKLDGKDIISEGCINSSNLGMFEF
jgi:hypothetical protein